jgi:hypothetical protein
MRLSQTGESVEDDLRGRRTAISRRAAGPVAKQFQKMSILVLGEDHPYCSRLARVAEAQHLSVSIYWSVDSLLLACSLDFDAAIVDGRLWPYARSVLAGWRRLSVVLLLDGAPSSPAAYGAGDYELLSLPRGSAPEQVLGTLGEAAQRLAASRAPEEAAAEAAAQLELAGS